MKGKAKGYLTFIISGVLFFFFLCIGVYLLIKKNTFLGIMALIFGACSGAVTAYYYFMVFRQKTNMK